MITNKIIKIEQSDLKQHCNEVGLYIKRDVDGNDYIEITFYIKDDEEIISYYEDRLILQDYNDVENLSKILICLDDRFAHQIVSNFLKDI